MSFLSQYDKIPVHDANARSQLLQQWLRTDWRSLFEELRLHRPVLETPGTIFVTRWADVVDVLSRHETFRVPYAPKMDPSVGPFMLARDGTPLNWHEKSVMQAVLSWKDLAKVRTLAGEACAKALARANGTVELVRTVGRPIPLQIVQDYFGFRGPDDKTVLRWSRATQHDMFYNAGNNPQIHEANKTAGAEMQSWIRSFLNTQRGGNSQPTAISRLIQTLHEDQPLMDKERVVSNICGLLVGTIEPTSQAIMQAVEQILRRTDVAVQAKEFAIYDNKSHFDPIVWEALRFSPFTLFVVRISAAEANIAPGAPHQVLVPKGQAVAACVGSAMFDEAIFPEPNKFVAGRPLQNYLHFGFGHHQCLGKYVGLEVIPEAVRRILQLPGVHLLEGDAGKIDFASGPFPERFEVGLETMLSDRGARRRETPTPARTPNRTRRHKRATPPNPK